MKRNRLVAITILLLLLAGAAYGQWQKIGKEQLPTNLGDTAADSLATDLVRAADATGLSLEDDGGNLGLFVEDGGQVGIGASNPEREFEITGSGNVVACQLENTGTGGLVYSIFSSNNGSGMGGGKFIIFDDTANVARLTIDNSGDVGIGVTNPSQPLHVQGVGVSEVIAHFDGDLTSFNRITIDGGAGGDTQTSYMNNGSTKWSVGNDAGTDSFIISKGYGAFGTDDYFSIDTSGAVGIGTVSPTNQLDVNGAIRTRSTTFNLDSDPIHNAAIGDYSFVKLTADSTGFELTGIVAGYDGQHLWLINRDGDLDQIDLMHNDAGSTAGNQFENPTGLTVSTDPGDAVELLYDSSGDGGSGAWVIVNVHQ